MNVLQHTRNELNLCLKENRPDRSYRDTLLKAQARDILAPVVQKLDNAIHRINHYPTDT